MGTGICTQVQSRHPIPGGGQQQERGDDHGPKDGEEDPTKKALEPKTKAKSAGGKKPADVKTEAPATMTMTEAAPANGAPATPLASHTPDPRLPAPGTLLQTRDRHGTVRCECSAAWRECPIL